MNPTRTRRAIEEHPSLAARARRAAAAALALWLLAWVPAGPGSALSLPAGSVLVAAVESHDPQTHGTASAPPPEGSVGRGAEAAPPQEPAAHGEAGSHEAQSPWALVARLFNFAVLAGTLLYFLRSPLMAFLKARGVEIRGSLATAAEMKAKAAQQIEEVERRLAALPAEIAALEARGTEEIAAEELRIRSAAEAERARLVEQARRQIDLQLRVARRDLTVHAADLAVARAAQRIKTIIQDDDQRRLVETYLTRLGITAPAAAHGWAAADRGASSGGQP